MSQILINNSVIKAQDWLLFDFISVVLYIYQLNKNTCLKDAIY